MLICHFAASLRMRAIARTRCSEHGRSSQTIQNYVNCYSEVAVFVRTILVYWESISCLTVSI